MTKRKFLFVVKKRKLKKEDFNNQLLRIIVALELFFVNVSNIKLQKTFFCLNDIIEFSFFSIIKNHFMLRYRKIQKKLLRDLFDDDIKISLFMNCWSFFNRQKYLIVIAYFIDTQWIYHEVLLAFEHISDFTSNRS
jgi:hypothetical protein